MSETSYAFCACTHVVFILPSVSLTLSSTTGDEHAAEAAEPPLPGPAEQRPCCASPTMPLHGTGAGPTPKRTETRQAGTVCLFSAGEPPRATHSRTKVGVEVSLEGKGTFSYGVICSTIHRCGIGLLCHCLTLLSFSLRDSREARVPLPACVP